MAWVVDTSVVLDLIVTGSAWRAASLACLQPHLADGLCVCPVTFVEVGPAFVGDSQAAEAFFQAIPISTSEPWTSADTELAHRLWNDHQVRRRAVQMAKRPVADVLIAAFASRFQGIITRNAADFRNISPTLTIVEP
jgi:predicted nucleic acid-binding protein